MLFVFVNSNDLFPGEEHEFASFVKLQQLLLQNVEQVPAECGSTSQIRFFLDHFLDMPMILLEKLELGV